MTLRSLYICRTQFQIRSIVTEQPTPLLFFKFFLEFNGINLASILSYDSTSMAYILSEKFSDLHDPEYPMFYKSKLQKMNEGEFNYMNAIDLALYHDSPSSVTLIINHLVNFQNDFVTHYLF